MSSKASAKSRSRKALKAFWLKDRLKRSFSRGRKATTGRLDLPSKGMREELKCALLASSCDVGLSGLKSRCVRCFEVTKKHKEKPIRAARSKSPGAHVEWKLEQSQGGHPSTQRITYKSKISWQNSGQSHHPMPCLVGR